MPRKSTKAAEEMTEEKKTPRTKKVKEPEAPKEPDVSIVLQYQGKDTDMNNLVQTIKSIYQAEGKTDPIETIRLYVQPENGLCYYVVNDNNEGRRIGF